VTDHQLFLFLVEMLVLIAAARTGGEIAVRLGIAQVVGELVVGILIGPSLFGKIWPGGFAALFPRDPLQRSLLEIVSWIGVIFLVLVSGLETRLGILRRAGKAVVTGWIGAFFLPFGFGFGLGWLIPANLIGGSISRPVFALFIATAMSISAIPVIARILIDLNLFRTKIGTIIISTAIADDTVGWIVLGVVSSLALSNHVDGRAVATALIGTGLFLLFAFTIGQRLVRMAMRGSEKLKMPFAQATVIMLIVLAGAATTQAVHVHLVLGCFVAGILIARSPGRGGNKATMESIWRIGMGIFVPFFFGYTGIKVDLTTLTGSALPVAVAAVVLAYAGKFIGGGVGSRLGGLSKWEALAVGTGLNARGAMELVIAAIGLSIGVLTVPMYTIIVVIAVLTSLTAAPMLRYCVRGYERQVERERAGAEVPAAVVSFGATEPFKEDIVNPMDPDLDAPLRRDEEGDFHKLRPETCLDCGCEHFVAKEDPSLVWEPGEAWEEDCRDRGCHCHTQPLLGQRRA
jgi:Kef-type K+ transport system membrane component KefB